MCVCVSIICIKHPSTYFSDVFQHRLLLLRVTALLPLPQALPITIFSGSSSLVTFSLHAVINKGTCQQRQVNMGCRFGERCYVQRSNRWICTAEGQMGRGKQGAMQMKRQTVSWRAANAPSNVQQGARLRQDGMQDGQRHRCTLPPLHARHAERQCAQARSVSRQQVRHQQACLHRRTR